MPTFPGRRVLRGLAVLAGCVPSLLLAEVGPAFTGLSGRADGATAAFFSPAGITRLERPEVAVQTMFAYAESKFDVDDASFAGGSSDNNDRVLVIPGIYYARPLSER